MSFSIPGALRGSTIESGGWGRPRSPPPGLPWLLTFPWIQSTWCHSCPVAFVSQLEQERHCQSRELHTAIPRPSLAISPEHCQSATFSLCGSVRACPLSSSSASGNSLILRGFCFYQRNPLSSPTLFSYPSRHPGILPSVGLDQELQTQMNTEAGWE